MKIQNRTRKFRLLPHFFILSLMCSMIFSGAFSVQVQAEEYWPAGIDLSFPDEAAVVMDIDTGTILYDRNGDEQHYPASITKVMTCLLACENSKPDEIVTFSYDAVHNIEVGSSSIWRDVDEQMTMEQTLYGLMLESANECAYAVAEHVGGDYQTFIDMMNERAAKLGCTNTHFMNPHGLEDDQHYTSAHDMALIAAEAYKNPWFAQICGTRNYQIPPTNKHAEITYCNNNHAMLHNHRTSQYLYDYCLGGKTGYTDIAGNTLVTYAKKGDMLLVCVVMKSHNPEHYTDTTALLNYCFDNFTVYHVDENADLFTDLSKKDAGKLASDVELVHLGDDGLVILPNGVDFSEASATMSPVKESDDGIIGHLEYTYAGRVAGGADLYFTEKEEETELPFLEISDGTEGSIEQREDYIQIDYRKILLYIALGIAGILVLALIVMGTNRFLLFKRRKLDPRKREKSPYKKVRHYNRDKKDSRFIK